jgi:TonB family protein
MANYHYPESFRNDGLFGVAVFRITLARSGEIVGLELIRSSGSSAVDIYAQEVIQRSSPVLPIPPKYQVPVLQLRMTFVVAPH